PRASPRLGAPGTSHGRRHAGDAVLPPRGGGRSPHGAPRSRREFGDEHRARREEAMSNLKQRFGHAMDGKRVPEVTFRTREGAGWKNLTTREIFAGQKVVVFALPGAFTPTCSSAHVPRYNELAPAFKALGIDAIVCISVN